MYSLIFAAATAALQPTVQTEDIRPVYFQKAEVEKKNFTGLLKVRQRTPEQEAYYLELKDGSIIHISTNVDSDTLQPFLNEQVKLLVRLREKTQYPNDFIRQVYTIEKAIQNI